MAAGRKPLEVEFLRKLRDMSYERLGIDKQSEFARRCDQYDSNMSDYLSGNKTPGDDVLWNCLQYLFEWQVTPQREVEEIPENLNDLPASGGVYILYDSAGNVLYVGKATNFRDEVGNTLGIPVPVGMRFGPRLSRTRPNKRDLATHLSLYEIKSERFRHNIEALLLRVFINQTHNSNIGKFT